MKKNKLLLAIGAAVLIGIVSLLSYNAQNQGTADDVIRIGAILPLTGETSYLGSEIQRGMESQCKILEAQGIKVQVIYQDSMYSAKGGIAAYQALQSRYQLPVVIVAGSAVANAVSEFVHKKKTDKTTLVGILVSSERSSEKNENFFRCWPSGNDEAKIMGKYLNKVGIAKNVGVLYQNDELGLDGKDAFVKCAKSLGINIAFEEAINKGLVDTDPLVGKLLAYSADKIYCVGSTPGIGLVVKSLKAHTYSGGFLFTSTLDVANLRAIIGDDAISGILYTSMFVPQQSDNDNKSNPEYRAFSEDLIKNGSMPNMLNIYGGVSVSFAQSICEKDRVDSAQTFKTVLGVLHLNDRQGIDFPMYIKRANHVQLGKDTICEVILP